MGLINFEFLILKITIFSVVSTKQKLDDCE